MVEVEKRSSEGFQLGCKGRGLSFDPLELFLQPQASKGLFPSVCDLFSFLTDPGSSTRKPCSQLPSPVSGDCQPLTQAASARPSRVLQRQSRVGVRFQRDPTQNRNVPIAPSFTPPWDCGLLRPILPLSAISEGGDLRTKNGLAVGFS